MKIVDRHHHGWIFSACTDQGEKRAPDRCRVDLGPVSGIEDLRERGAIDNGCQVGEVRSGKRVQTRERDAGAGSITGHRYGPETSRTGIAEASPQQRSLAGPCLAHDCDDSALLGSVGYQVMNGGELRFPSEEELTAIEHAKRHDPALPPASTSSDPT
jgi:hypothetical protein